MSVAGIVSTATSARSFILYGMALAGMIVLGLGPLKGLVVVIGIAVACVSFAHPITGLIIAIFANTSLQVLGSSHITGFPTSLSKMFGAITLGALILHMLYARWKITASPIYRPIFLFGTIVLVADLTMRNPETSMLEGTMRLFMMALLMTTIATFAGQSRRNLETTVLAMAAAIGLCGVIGLAEHFLPSLAIASDDPRLAQGAIGGVIDSESLDGVVIKRITGGIGDANWLSYTIAMSVPLLVYLWHQFTSPLARAIIVAVGVLQLGALVLSYTRTGFLGLGVAGLYLIVRGVVPLRPMLFLGALAFCVSLIYLPPGFVDRMFSTQYLKEGSTPLRMLFWTRAVELWGERPVFGYGYAGYGPNFYQNVLATLPNDDRLIAWAHDMEKSVIEGRELVSNIGAHSLQLEILVEYGVVGFVLYFAIFVVAFRELRRIEIRGPPDLRILAICLSAGLIAFLVCGLLGHAKYLKYAWMLLGLTMAAARVAMAGDSPTRSLLQSSVAR